MDTETTIYGVLLGLCAASLLGVAMPVYLVRHVGVDKAPPIPSGRVPIAGFGLGDVLGVMAFLCLYGLGLVSEDPELSSQNLIVVLGSQVVIAGLIVAALYWRMNLVATWGLRWRQWPMAFAAVPIVLIMYGFMVLLEQIKYNQWVASLVEGDPTQEMVKVLQESTDPGILALTAVVAVVGAPLSEEIIFRGYIYPAVKRLLGMRFSVVFSALLFAAVHLNLHAMLPLFVLGIILAVAYERTGSLWMPIAIHMVFNAATVVIQQMARLHPEWFEEAGEAAMLWPG